jgi:diguanylate cyclase (GGDEF)-like protein
MPDSSPDQHTPAQPKGATPAAVREGFAETLLLGTALLLGLLSLLWMVRLAHGREPENGNWEIQVLLTAGCLAAVVCAMIRRRRLGASPVARTLDAVARVRSGAAPLESLARVPGLPASFLPVVEVLHDLLHELRVRKSEIARLENEMGRRVASRTDALERELGSMKQKAARDPLTGLYNRRMLDEHLSRVIEARKVDHGTLSLLMIDVDDFKHLNDTLGHLAGDELLRSIGQIIRSSLRDADLAFRYGGDEFVILCDGCDTAAARHLGERLASLVDQLAKPLKLPLPPRLTFGVRQWSEIDCPSAESLLAQADRLLYDAKSARKRSA